jgi:hypothetical protein
LELPPYSPELNPVERVWHYLRSHWLANSVFRSLGDIMDACETAWNRFAADDALIRSLCAIAWAPALPGLIDGACLRTVAGDGRHTRVQKLPEIRIRRRPARRSRKSPLHACSSKRITRTKISISTSTRRAVS